MFLTASATIASTSSVGSMRTPPSRRCRDAG
jgi:hypothetical protein